MPRQYSSALTEIRNLIEYWQIRRNEAEQMVMSLFEEERVMQRKDADRKKIIEVPT